MSALFISLLDNFVVRAALAGLAVAVAAAPMGCFVVWRRMAYFGDATAHAAMLGVALSLAFAQSVFVGTMVVAMAMAYLVSNLSWRGHAIDTLLGVLAHSSLAIGLVAVSLFDNNRIDLDAYLFGDILAVSDQDLLIMWIGAALATLLIVARWQKLLLLTLSADLAAAGGLNPRREQLVLTVSLALVVAIAIKVVGVLLITAMLIIPAAAARPLSHTPERMAILALGVGVSSIFLGLAVSYYTDTPTGPTIVCVSAMFFVVATVASLLRRP